MRIELKNVRHAKFASRETECFEASVYINGVASGKVSNDGQGGANCYSPPSIEDALNAYAKTLPPMETEYEDPTSPTKRWMLPYSADLLIGEALNKWRARSEMVKAMTNRILFIADDGRLMQTRKLTPSEMDNFLRNPHLLGVLHPGVILNTLKEEAALEIYMTRSG